MVCSGELEANNSVIPCTPAAQSEEFNHKSELCNTACLFPWVQTTDSVATEGPVTTTGTLLKQQNETENEIGLIHSQLLSIVLTSLSGFSAGDNNCADSTLSMHFFT